MEGDAGAGRLNPPPMSMIRRLRNRRPRIRQESDAAVGQATTDVTAEDASASEAGTEQIGTEVTAEDASASEAGTEQIGTEVTAEDSNASEAGTEQIGTEVTAEDSAASEAAADALETDAERRPSRLGRGWLAGIAAALVLVAGGIGAGGYLALRSHQDSQAIARNNAAALQAAKVCVAATQAPDTSAMAASEQKIIDCGTDVYRTQALLYSSLLVQAYQASNAHVQVSDERAAVERNNNDGSVDVLVALRVKVSNDQAQNQETGYRLRVRMSPVDGQYKISKLDQVTK
jgi:Mce-associated membrane protein